MVNSKSETGSFFNRLFDLPHFTITRSHAATAVNPVLSGGRHHANSAAFLFLFGKSKRKKAALLANDRLLFTEFLIMKKGGVRSNAYKKLSSIFAMEDQKLSNLLVNDK